MSSNLHDGAGDRPKKVPLQADLYGVKVPITPHPGEPAPRSWREVGRRVNLSLMRFCSDGVALLADVVTGARAIVRGIARLPAAISRRVDRAHDKADRALAVTSPDPGSQVAVVEAEPVPVATPAAALAELEAVFAELRAQGLYPELRRLATGQWVVVIVAPELQPAAKCAAVRAIEGQVLDIADVPVRPLDPALPAPVPLEDSGLRAAVVQKLKAAGYDDMEQLFASGPGSVAAVPGIGPKSFRAIVEALARCGLRWQE